MDSVGSSSTVSESNVTSLDKKAERMRKLRELHSKRVFVIFLFMFSI